MAQPQSNPPCPECGKVMRLQHATNKIETFFGGSRLVPSVQKGGARTTYSVITCFTVCALVESVSSEESFSMWNVPTASQPEQEFPAGATSVSFVFWNHGKALRAIVQMFPDQPQKITVSNTVVNRLELSWRARLWNHKASVNDALWESCCPTFLACF